MLDPQDWGKAGAGRGISAHHATTSGNQPTGQGWGLEYSYDQTHHEKETMAFQSAGLIKTADGKEISFSLNLTMSREFFSRESINLRAGDALIDPLVINFDGHLPELTEVKFEFDLDANGKPDQISFLRPGSGFLALDRNGDGIINDGRELFGPLTGDGFKELSRYDADQNNWIDENDDIFHELRIWTKDSQGNDILFGLGEKGIGAIFLGNIEAPFSLKDNANTLLGQVQKTGLFIKEDGTPGTVQQIDMAV